LLRRRRPAGVQGDHGGGEAVQPGLGFDRRLDRNRGASPQLCPTKLRFSSINS
jgi:hypothetical protein